MSFGSRRNRKLLVLVLSGLALTYSASVGANAVYDLLKSEPSGAGWSIALVSSVCSILLSWLVATTVRAISGTHAHRWGTDKSESADYQALILMPSFIAGDAAKIVDNAIAFVKEKATTDEHALALIVDPSAAGDFNRWPWQHTLRLLRAHPRLKIITVVQSRQSAKHKQFEEFQRLIKIFRPQLEVLAVPQAVDLLDYNNIEETLESAMALCRKKGVWRSKTCIDITGGPKSFSAVAAVKTLNSPYVFSYVVTQMDTDDTAEFGKVYWYDASVWNAAQ
jgi:hypothetical protein